MVYILKEDNVVCEFASFQTCWNHLEKGVMMADLKHFDLSMKHLYQILCLNGVTN